jgi:hypothetical protein
MILKTYKYTWFKSTLVFLLLGYVFQYSSCRIGTKDVSIPPEVKTFSLDLFGNKASLVNPQLAPRLTEKFRQKVINQTRLRPLAEKGDYAISGYINSYMVTTSGISNGVAGNNRLAVAFHVILKDNLNEKRSFEADVSRSFEFSANTNLRDAEIALIDEMTRTLSDEVFNKIFSNW